MLSNLKMKNAVDNPYKVDREMRHKGMMSVKKETHKNSSTAYE